MTYWLIKDENGYYVSDVSMDGLEWKPTQGRAYVFDSKKNASTVKRFVHYVEQDDGAKVVRVGRPKERKIVETMTTFEEECLTRDAVTGLRYWLEANAPSDAGVAKDLFDAHVDLCRAAEAYYERYRDR